MSQPKNITRWAWSLLPIGLLTVACLGQESKNETAEHSHYQLMVQHAKAKMNLAEVELEQVEAVNAKDNGVIPRFVIERLRSNLAVAIEQFNEASMASSDGPERVRMRHAEEKIRLASMEFDAGKMLRSEGEISELQLRRLELKVEIARLNLSLLKYPENFVTLLNHVQGKVDRLGEEMITLDQRISKLEESINLLAL